MVRRNQVRDYLDVAAVGTQMGIKQACATLSNIDSYYSEMTETEGSVVSSELIYMLASPNPADTRNRDSLAEYKGVSNDWDSWSRVEATCKELAACLT